VDGRRSKTNEDAAKEYLKPLAVDELVIVLKQVFDAEYVKRLAAELARPVAVERRM
jgi:hypothetical protein